MSELIWMRHDATGGHAQLPDLPYWRGQGWNPSDPPPADDTLRDPAPAPAPEAPAATTKPAATQAKPEEK
jgi:hypothetical protein